MIEVQLEGAQQVRKDQSDKFNVCKVYFRRQVASKRLRLQYSQTLKGCSNFFYYYLQNLKLKHK